jgi:arginase
MADTPLKSVSIISSPYHVGVHNQGPGKGPDFLRSHGLLEEIRKLGVTVYEVAIDPVDEFEGEIGRSFEILRRTSKLVTQERNRGSFPIVLAGNCVASIGVSAGLSASEGLQDEELACVFFDAHDDYNTPDTVVSGYFDSMAISMLMGECWKQLLSTVPGYKALNPNRLIHVGMRDVTELERQRVLDAGMEVVWGGEERPGDRFGQGFHLALLARLDRLFRGDTLARGGKQPPSMIHVDLDCLDASLGKANKFAAPGGLDEQELLASLSNINLHTLPVALTVASFDPTYEGADKIAEIAVKAVVSLVHMLITLERLEKQ